MVLSRFSVWLSDDMMRMTFEARVFEDTKFLLVSHSHTLTSAMRSTPTSH